jgi:hypothetical protein
LLDEKSFSVSCKMLIVAAASLCLFISSFITLSGLETGSYCSGGLEWFNGKFASVRRDIWDSSFRI